MKVDYIIVGLVVSIVFITLLALNNMFYWSGRQYAISAENWGTRFCDEYIIEDNRLSLNDCGVFGSGIVIYNPRNIRIWE
jgi:hypothetical protein